MAHVLEYTKPYPYIQLSDKAYQAHTLILTLRKQTNKPTTHPHTGSKANKTNIHPSLYESQFRSLSYMAQEIFGKTRPKPRRCKKRKFQ